MKNVVLARDRRKKKLRNRIIIFLILFIILVFAIVKVTNQNITNSQLNNTDFTTSVQDEQADSIGTSSSTTNNEQATSYNDNIDFDDLSVDDEELPDEVQQSLDDLLDAVDQAWRIKNQFSETVDRGDSLIDILGQSGIDKEDVSELIKEHPELNKLKEGEQFYWVLNKDGVLQYLDWQLSEREENIYELQSDGKYTHQHLTKKSEWKTDVIKGSIQGGLNQSLFVQGVSRHQALQLNKALQWQISLKKLYKGDKFAILVRREYLDGKPTDIGNVEAIHLIHNGKSYYAIQASNGKYYNRYGETLGRGFSRYPLIRQARISSSFNPRRRHPITHRISPHNGVDFAVPSGTPIIAPADGKVVKVAYQAGGAGRYIVIQHGKMYRTVYMHLSRALVKTGQTVSRGQRIAKSGNTGRSTGAHLHYEFRINNRPVNPMTVRLPGMNSAMSSKARKSFLKRATSVIKKLAL